MSEIQNVTQALFLPLAERLNKFALKFKTELGHDYSITINDIIVEWNESTKTRTNISSELDTARPAFETIWDAICKQLYKNTLSIVLANLDNPDILLTYFDEKIVNFRKHNIEKTDYNTYNLNIAPATSATADFTFAATDTLLIINNSNIPVYFYAAPAPNAPQPAQLTEITADYELEITATQLGSPANKYLIFVNKDAAATAELEIALIS